MKYNDENICQKCSFILAKYNINILNYKKYTLDQLKNFVNQQKEIKVKEKQQIEQLDYIIDKYPNTATNNNNESYKDVEQKPVINNSTNNQYQALLEKRKQAKTIKQVIIIGNETDARKKVGSTVIWGAVGGFALGPVGLIGGALSGKNKVKTKVTFLVEYEDGHKETKVVDNNSSEFNKLCQYIKI